ARVARWAATNGAQHLVLTGRRGPDAPGAAELRDELAATGVRVTIAACDVADRDALAQLATGLQTDGTPVRTVVHAAGVGQITPLAEIGGAELVDVLHAKVTGAANLDAVFADTELDAFVLFSSIAAVWGSGGQAGYAAANAYLDALAQERRARGRVATSIAWGPWGGGGLVDVAEEEMLRRRGLPVMEPGSALTALAQALTGDETCLAVADVIWNRFTPAFTAMRPSPLLGDLPENQRLAEEAAQQEQAPAAGSGDAAAALRERLVAAGNEAARDEILFELVRGETARVLGIATPAQIKPRRGFVEMGFDSLMAVELRNGLTKQTGFKLPATLIFDFPTSVDLVRHLGEQFAQQNAGPAGGPVNGSEAVAEIEKLERVLTSISSQAVDGADITKRLEALLSRWNAAQGANRSNPEPMADDLLAAASPDELFELIQREFGKS
ncbi:SDR family NAD(P)-dependent oxidoreductase, partial [Streptomyces sp. NPDC127117]|uniref:type I polyketide synthase n=1 Tax=Streptomyces sp. NPDC127117 TaxID=3345368 RepID=UPI00362E06C2